MPSGNRNPASETAPKAKQLLESWKQIASYLDVSVRTAQLWERHQGLPIHRRGGVKPRVWASIEELDAWRVAERPSHRTTIRRIVRASLIFIVLCGLAVEGWMLVDRGTVQDLVIVDRHLRALDSSDRVLWEKGFSDLSQRAYDVWVSEPEAQCGDLALLEDANGDGNPEVFFSSLAEETLTRTGQVLAYSNSGKQLWHFDLDQELSFRERVYAGFDPALLGIHNELLLVQAHHNRFFPSLVAFLDTRTGRPVDQYWHPGFFRDYEFLDTDDDGRDELLLTATNNPGKGRGHSTLAVLQIPPAPKEAENPGPFNGNRILELRYLMFPAFDIQRVQKDGSTAWLTKTLRGEILVEVRSKDCNAFYYFDTHLQLLRTSFSDDCYATHRNLYNRRVLDHMVAEDELAGWSHVLEFETAPDGNSPKITRLFREAPDCDASGLKPCLQRTPAQPR